MKRRIIFYALSILFTGTLYSCKTLTGNSTVGKKTFGEISKEESTVPIRPGVPGQSPFWNEKAHQFIYAPAFDYKVFPDAGSYRYNISSADNSHYNFASNVPYSPLSKVWASMPTGFFELNVAALNSDGDSLGLAGSGKYYKAAHFNGPYHKPVMPYDESAKIALDNLLRKDYVEYWLKNKVPNQDYQYYRYPAKIYSALVAGAVTHARLKANTDDAKRSVELAKIIADYMINISYKKGSVWEYFIPTYFGPRIQNKPGSHVNLTTNFTVMGADAGNAFLDLFNLTGNKKYFEAAKRI